MNSLYDLTGEYKALYAMLTDADEDDKQVVEDTLEAVMGEIEVKGGNYIALMNQLSMEQDACDRHIAEWTYKKQVRENAIKRLKDRLAAAMMQMGKKELPAGDNTIKLVNNGGKQPLRYFNNNMSYIPQEKVDVTTLPKKYRKTVITETIDTDEIRKDLDAGVELDFVKYGERGQHIRIK